MFGNFNFEEYWRLEQQVDSICICAGGFPGLAISEQQTGYPHCPLGDRLWACSDVRHTSHYHYHTVIHIHTSLGEMMKIRPRFVDPATRFRLLQ
jgi:hypothetical protein